MNLPTTANSHFPTLVQIAASQLPRSQRCDVPTNVLEVESSKVMRSLQIEQCRNSKLIGQLAKEEASLAVVYERLNMLRQSLTFDADLVDTLTSQLKEALQNVITVKRKLATSASLLQTKTGISTNLRRLLIVLTPEQNERVIELLGKKANMLLWVEAMKQLWLTSAIGGTNMNRHVFLLMLRLTYHDYPSEMDATYLRKSDFANRVYWTSRHLGNVYQSELFFETLREYITKLSKRKAYELLVAVTEALDRMGVFFENVLNIRLESGYDKFVQLMRLKKTPSVSFVDFAPSIPSIIRSIEDIREIENGLYEIHNSYTNMFHEQGLMSPHLSEYLARGTQVLHGGPLWKTYLIHNEAIKWDEQKESRSKSASASASAFASASTASSRSLKVQKESSPKSTMTSLTLSTASASSSY